MFIETSGKLIDANEVSRMERQGDKDQFYRLMKDYGFDFNDVDMGETSAHTWLPKSLIPVADGQFEAVLKFNNALMDLHRKRKIAITDALVYLTEDYFEPNDLLKMLQTINLNYLQNDLREKYNIDKHETVSKFNDFIS